MEVPSCSEDNFLKLPGESQFPTYVSQTYNASRRISLLSLTVCALVNLVLGWPPAHDSPARLHPKAQSTPDHLLFRALLEERIRLSPTAASLQLALGLPCSSHCYGDWVRAGSASFLQPECLLSVFSLSSCCPAFSSSAFVYFSQKQLASACPLLPYPGDFLDQVFSLGSCCQPQASLTRNCFALTGTTWNGVQEI